MTSHPSSKSKTTTASLGANDPAFEGMNDQFHATYDHARSQSMHNAPIFILLEDQVILRRGEAREVVTIDPPVFRIIRSVAHAAVAVFMVFYDNRGRDVHALDERLARAQIEMKANAEGADAQTLDHLTRIIDRTRAFIAEVGAESSTRSPALAFARDAGALILRGIDDATALQLAMLDHEVRRLLDAMTAEERKTFRVVVTGNHQARVRSLGMQYFAKVIGPEASQGERLMYGEGISTEDQAVALAQTEQIDRVLARAFFGDPSRMQKDLLGDAAARLLADFDVARVG